MKQRTKNDWVTAVLNDLDELNIKLEMEQMKTMKKSSFMGIIKEEIRAKTLRNMEKIKQYHTKVKNIEYKEMKIQKYLLPNSCKMTKEEAQMIFKLRCRVVKVKNNLKGMFDDLQCRACGREEETQEHITIHCKKLNNNKRDMNIKYEKLFNGKVSEKLMIAKLFKENYEFIENMKK